MTGALSESLLDKDTPARPFGSRGLAVALLVLVSLLGSTDPLLVHFMQMTLVEAKDTNLPILFWKHVGMTVVGGTYALIHHFRMHGQLAPTAGERGGILGLRQLGTAVLMMALCNLCWTWSMILTTASHSVALFIMQPPWSCLFAWVFLGQRPGQHTLLASILAFAAAMGIVMYSYSLPPLDNPASLTVHSTGVTTDAIALSSGIFLAGYTTALSWAAETCPEAPMHLASPMASGLIAVGTYAAAAMYGIPLGTLMGEGAAMPGFAVAMAINSFNESIWDIAPAWASKFLSAPSIGLILLLELPVGTTYVAQVFGERPDGVEIALGLAMLVALAIEHVLPWCMPSLFTSE